jgi:hypothetical protein
VNVLHVLALGIAALVHLAASPADPFPQRVNARTRRAVLTEMVRQLHARYVFPDSVARIQARIESRLRSGAYDSTVTPASFGAAVTEDLRAFDIHFDLRFDVERERALRAAGADTLAVLPELDPSPDSLAALRRGNFGFRAAEVLPGNIGYLDVTALHDLRFARSAAVAAIEFIANSPAVILDLRSAPGGYGSMVQFLVSSFFGADSVELLTTFDRELGTTRRGWSNPAISPRHLPDADLYILASGSTGSAAEALAFSLQVTGRATVVGERTAGAAHVGGWVPLGRGFVVFVPNTRGFDPRTGKDWERTGVQPDIAAPKVRALEVAHAEAVRRLEARETDARQALELRWLSPLLNRRAAGALAVRRELLQRYAGSYVRCEIRIEQDELRFVGASGVAQRLIPLTEELFLIEDERMPPPEQVRVRFVPDTHGEITSLELLVRDGRVLPRARIVP